MGCCASAVSPPVDDYVGLWTGKDATCSVMLIIARDGHMKYQKVAINSKTSMTLPVTEWTSDGFKTGMCCYRYTFYTTGPNLQADGATMVLDGVTLHRKQ